MTSVGSPLLWAGFAAFVLAMLALDLGVFHRKCREISARDAMIWTAVWVALSLAFAGGVAWQFGADAAEAFLAGYVIEKALSIDNLFVFYVVFSAFRVPLAYQHKVLFWGILGALVLRAALIWGGSLLLERFHFLVYAFGTILVVTGVRMLRRREEHVDPERGRTWRFLRRVIPTTEADHGARFVAKEDGAWRATPLLLVLVLVELTDLVFALDSILAIFAISSDPFIVFTSNVFAVMGMRSLYVVLANAAQRFVYVQPGLALVLVLVGLKMALSEWIHVPVLVSLLVVVGLIGGSVVLSLIKTRRDDRGRTTTPPRGAAAT